MTDQGPTLDSAPISASDSAPFAEPASYLPRLENPDNTFTSTPSSVAELNAHHARWLSVKPALAWTVLTAPLYILFLSVLGAAPAVIVSTTGLLVVIYYGSTYRSMRKLLSSVTRHEDPISTSAVRLGADGLDLCEPHALSRIAYDRVTALTASRRVAVLRFDGMRIVMPRRLWPDDLVARLDDLRDPTREPTPHDPPPLPPLPVVARPHVATVAGPGTAELLAEAAHRQPWLRPAGIAVAVVLAVMFLELAVIGGYRFGAPGAVLPPVIGVILGVWTITHTPRKYLHHYRRSAFPGAALSAVFGSDAVVLTTPAWIMRVPYTAIGSITVRPEVSALYYGRLPIMLPSALFPAHIADGLRRHGVGVDDRR